MFHRVILPLFLLLVSPLAAQVHDSGNYPYTLRGEVWIDLEPIYGGYIEDEYPVNTRTAALRALELSAMFFSGMIYGWSFSYDIGERARRISENFELKPVASIPFGDSGLSVTEVEIKDHKVRMWADYNLSDPQQRRLAAWQTGNIRRAQGIGYWLPGLPPVPSTGGLGSHQDGIWLEVKRIALEDAARAAVRGMLQGSERNRPKEAHGFISLASFPHYYIDSGRWAVSARFRVEITEIIPFAVH